MQEYIWILWDILAVLIIAHFVHNGAVRGLVRTVMSLVGYLVALLVARLLGPILSVWLYNTVIKDALVVVLSGRVEEALASTGGAATELLELIPNQLRRILDSDVTGVLGDFTSDTEQLVETLVESALRNPVLSITQGILFLILFSLTLLLVRRLSWMFSGVNRLPIIGTVNTLLGGVFGVLQAVLAMIVGAILLHLVILFAGGALPWLTPQVLEDTYIWRVFYHMVS